MNESANNSSALEKPSLDRAFAVIAMLYFATRLAQLTILPIFNDEAVYLHWADMIRENPSDFLVSVQADNKKPLQMWLIAVALNFFSDPLQAGRFVSVLTGFGALVGVHRVGSRLGSARAGSLAALLYVISPYHLMFDRLIHESSLIDCIFVWTLWLILAVFDKEPRPRPLFPILLFILTGLGLLTISFAVLFVFLPLAFKPFFIGKRDALPWKPAILASLGGVSLGGLPYAILYFTTGKLSMKSYFIPSTHAQGNAGILDLIFSMPLMMARNINRPFEYFYNYLTWPVCLLALAYLLLQLKSLDRKTLLVAACFLIPTLAIAGSVSEGFSRYYLFCATPLVLWAALAADRIIDIALERLPRPAAHAASAAILAALSVPAISFDAKLVGDPANAPFTGRDRYQFVSSEFSGYGVPEAVEFLKQAAKQDKITVLIPPDWGNPADALSVYFSRQPNIEVHMAWWWAERPLITPDLKKIAQYNKFTGKRLDDLDPAMLQEVYFVMRTSSGFPRDLFMQVNGNFRLVQAFKKPGSALFVEVFKLTD